MLLRILFSMDKFYRELKKKVYKSLLLFTRTSTILVVLLTTYLRKLRKLRDVQSIVKLLYIVV